MPRYWRADHFRIDRVDRDASRLVRSGPGTVRVRLVATVKPRRGRAHVKGDRAAKGYAVERTAPHTVGGHAIGGKRQRQTESSGPPP